MPEVGGRSPEDGHFGPLDWRPAVSERTRPDDDGIGAASRRRGTGLARMPVTARGRSPPAIGRVRSRIMARVVVIRPDRTRTRGGESMGQYPSSPQDGVDHFFSDSDDHARRHCRLAASGLERRDVWSQVLRNQSAFCCDLISSLCWDPTCLLCQAELASVAWPVIQHRRRQMPVGQGGFHVGELWPISGAGSLSAAGTVYFYDCGSVPKQNVDNEIVQLRGSSNLEKLDFLILSHFDIDHICGTPTLLAGPPRGFGVDTIMLPFVDMEERVLALARSSTMAPDQSSTDNFYLRAIADPVSALSEFAPSRIILVRGDEDGPLEEPGFEPIDPEGEREAFEGVVWTQEPARPDRPMRRWRRVGSRGPEVLLVQNAALSASAPGLRRFWRLVPHVRPADPRQVDAFRRRVEATFGWPAGYFLKNVSNPKTLERLVTDDRMAFGRAYRTAFRDKNLTSLCLYSGPYDPDRFDACTPDFDPDPSTKIGWLATGDAHLSDGADVSSLRSHYGSDLDFVSTFVFPHHGSINNTDPANLVCDAEAWVAPADPRNKKWRHPHPRLSAEVGRRGGTFRHVKSRPDGGYDERFIVWPTP